MRVKLHYEKPFINNSDVSASPNSIISADAVQICLAVCPSQHCMPHDVQDDDNPAPM